MGQTEDANERPANVNKQARLGIVVVFVGGILSTTFGSRGDAIAQSY